jgi:hypothetical protein
MPVVTGTTTPAIAGTYAVSGTNDGQPTYTRTTGSPLVLWWFGTNFAWYLTDGVGNFNLGGASGGFYRLNLPLSDGALTPFGGASGSATLKAEHVYWRINIAANNGRVNTQISEVQMFAAIGGANLLSGGTASASSQNSATYSAAKACDGDTATAWVTSNGAAAPSWWRYAFASPVDVAAFSLRLDSGGNDAFPKDFSLQYSDDGTNWITVHSWAGQSTAGGVVQTYAVPQLPIATPGTHYNWRLLIAATNGDSIAGLSEIEMRAIAGGADQCTGGGPFSSDAANVDFTAAYAFDNVSAGTAWNSHIFFPVHVGYAFPEPVVVRQLVLYGLSEAGLTKCPGDFAFQYSDDGTNWITVHSWSGVTWTGSETKTFAVDATPVASLGDTFAAAADTLLSAWTATGPNGVYTYGVTSGTATVLAATDVCQWTTATSSVMEARAERDLTSPDMAVQFTLTDTPAVSGNSFEAIARFSASVRSYYGLRYRWGNNDLRLFKRLNGSTNTQIGSTVTGLTPTAGQVLRLEVRTTSPGTTELRGYIDGVLRIGPATDTEASIQSTTRAGFAFVGTRTAIGIDNFSAAVLAPLVTARPPRSFPRGLCRGLRRAG